VEGFAKINCGHINIIIFASGALKHRFKKKNAVFYTI